MKHFAGIWNLFLVNLFELDIINLFVVFYYEFTSRFMLKFSDDLLDEYEILCQKNNLVWRHMNNLNVEGICLIYYFLSLSFPFILHTCKMSNYVTLLKEIQSVFIFINAAHLILLLCKIVYRNHHSIKYSWFVFYMCSYNYFFSFRNGNA